MVRFSICKRHLTHVINRIYATKPFFPKKLAETRFLKFFSYFREQFPIGLIADGDNASRIQRRVKHANSDNRATVSQISKNTSHPLPFPFHAAGHPAFIVGRRAVKPARRAVAAAAAARRRARRLNFRGQQANTPSTSLSSHPFASQIFFPTYKLVML